MKTDAQLKTDVTTELQWVPALQPTDIKVATKVGTVTLSGSVPHYAEKQAAERAAQRVEDVREFQMAKRFLLLVAFVAISFCFSATAQAQYGGLQVQVGSYGTGVRVGGVGFGNGFYNSYGNGYGYGGYRNGYGYGQPSIFYRNGGNYGGFGYGTYPTISYGYGTPRLYPTPVRRYVARRFR